ncbi:hypothetical protein [Nocardiopsis trehalosi]|uniref:hypothetical protein n=1 Tax=Nocardiopsis trehalosi TaxID=109329 RepID=UPI0008334B0E|nr:hypothetical protein [Nocardiopsis trehalosi]
MVRVYNTETGKMEILVATDTPQRTAPPRWGLTPDERFVPGPGHAEQAIVDYVNDNPKYQIVEGGGNRNICQKGESETGDCLAALQGEGLRTGGNYNPGTRYTSGLRHFWWG